MKPELTQPGIDKTSRLVVKWNLPPDQKSSASSYKVSLRSMAGQTFTENVDGPANMYVAKNLTAGERYQAMVQSISSGGAPTAFSGFSNRSDYQRTGEYYFFNYEEFQSIH